MFSITAIPPLAANHVPILAGTDAKNPGTAPGISLHRELEYLVKAGLTPERALAPATSVPASAFHLTDRGRIARGMRADLVLLNGDPIADISATHDIRQIWKAGIPVDRDSWCQHLQFFEVEPAVAETHWLTAVPARAVVTLQMMAPSDCATPPATIFRFASCKHG